MTTFDARGAVLETLLLEAIECARMAICVYDDHGRYVTVNDCACTILGYSREELLTHDVADFTQGGIDRTVLLKEEHREGVRMVTRATARRCRARSSSRRRAWPVCRTSSRSGGRWTTTTPGSPTRPDAAATVQIELSCTRPSTSP